MKRKLNKIHERNFIFLCLVALLAFAWSGSCSCDEDDDSDKSNDEDDDADSDDDNDDDTGGDDDDDDDNDDDNDTGTTEDPSETLFAEGVSVENTAVGLAPDGRRFIAYDDNRSYLKTPACCEVRVLVVDGDDRIDKRIDWGGYLGGNFCLEVTENGEAHLLYGGEESIWYAQFGDEFIGS